MGLHSEVAYLFRHALLRDAAYQLQLPGDRARLHGLAFEVIEALAGGRPPGPAPLDEPDPPPFLPHATDPVAFELARHARAADFPAVSLYLRRAAEVAARQFRPEAAQDAWM
ncbi:MAG: hypothetical protein FD180_5167, partial [Planctomycetota bacterium]